MALPAARTQPLFMKNGLFVGLPKTINLFYLNNIIIKDVDSKKNVISRTLNSIYWITFAADFKKCNE